MDVQIVNTKQQLRQFVRLPAQLHRNDSGWIPPIFHDDQKRLHSFLFEDTNGYEMILAIFWSRGEPVGRIAGIINKHHNQKEGLQQARFGFIDLVDDTAVSEAMFSFVEQWAREQGQEQLVGPMGFTDQDPEGLLIEGFEHTPSLATYANAPYLVKLVDCSGYKKEVDYLTYKVEIEPELLTRYQHIGDRLLSKNRYQVVEFESRWKLKNYVVPILQLMNKTFEPLYGFMPLSEEEMEKLAKRYIPILDPRFVKVVAKDEEVVGFIIAMPNIIPGLRRSGGKLLPFGWFDIWKASRRSRQLDLMLGGIKKEFRGRGVDTLLGIAMLESAQKNGMERIDSHHILESNRLMRDEMTRWGGTIYKRHRIYRKNL